MTTKTIVSLASIVAINAVNTKRDGSTRAWENFVPSSSRVAKDGVTMVKGFDPTADGVGAFRELNLNTLVSGTVTLRDGTTHNILEVEIA